MNNHRNAARGSGGHGNETVVHDPPITLTEQPAGRPSSAELIWKLIQTMTRLEQKFDALTVELLRRKGEP